MFYKSFTIKCRDSAEVVCERLRDAVAQRTFFGISFGRKPFVGEVGSRGFVVMRITASGKAAWPVGIGEIRDTLDGSTVDVRLRWNLPGLIFLCCWTAGLLVMGPCQEMRRLLNGDLPLTALLPFLAMAILPWCVFSIAFAWEVPLYQRQLRRIITASESDEGEIPDQRQLPVWAIVGVVLTGGFLASAVAYGIFDQLTRPPVVKFVARDPNSATVVWVSQYSKSQRKGLCDISVDGRAVTQHAGWPDVPLPDDAVPTKAVWHSHPNWVEIVFSNGQRLKLTWDEQLAQQARDQKAGRFYINPRYKAIAGPAEQPAGGR